MSDTESFESVMSTFLDGFIHDVLTNQLRGPYDMIAVNIERLRRAHEREVRDVAQREYHRGYEDGRHSMDAEHRAVAMRLRQLPLDGGSHENLSQIARAVYHSDFGWTQGACAALRDKLIELMGGVSDGRTGAVGVTEPIGCNDGRGDDCDGRDSVEQGVSDGRFADDCGADAGCGDGGGDLHLAGVTTYDVLWNERHKAVCKLRKLTIDSDYYGNYQRIALAIGTVYDGSSFASECVRDRLTHLLGGNQPSGIDVLREMDGESDADGTCPNDVPTSSITHELRECVSTASKSYDDTPWYDVGESEEPDHTICHVTEGELLRVSDHIDEQFDRICQQQEDVLQSTIDGAGHRLKDADKQRDEMQRELEYTKKSLDGMREQRDHWADEAIEMFRVFFPHDEYCVPNSPSKMVIPKINEMQKKLDEYDRTHVELPKDVYGEHVRPGDRLTDGKCTFVVDEVAYDGEGWSVRNKYGVAWALCDVYHVAEGEES